MTQLFTPPFPEPPRTKRGLAKRFVRGWRSWIHVLFEKSYTMKLGEIHMPGQTMYIANELPLVDKILKGGIAYPKHSEMVRDMWPLIGNAIFSANGHDWENQRAMMNPAFAHAGLVKSFPMMKAAVDDLVARLDAKDLTKPIDIDPMMTHVAADIIFRTLFSETLDAERSYVIHTNFAKYQRYAHIGGMLRLYRIPSGLFERRTEKPSRNIRAVFHPIVEARYKAWHERGEATHQDILQSLIEVKHPETGLPFTFDELMGQVTTIFLAGHETAAGSMSWSFYLLAACQHIQDRARAEVAQVAGDAPFTAAVLKDMPHLRNVFREALRLYPSVPFLPREVACPMQMRDKDLKVGALLVVSPWLTQRNKDNWACPHSFDPDRFDDPDNAEMIKQAYFPFGRGPRICVGAGFAQQEAMITLASVLRRFRVKTTPGFTPEAVSLLTLRPRKGMKVMLGRI